MYTRKNAQVVTQTCSNAVPTTSQQDVFALLVPSLLTSIIITKIFTEGKNFSAQDTVINMCPQRLVHNLLQGC